MSDDIFNALQPFSGWFVESPVRFIGYTLLVLFVFYVWREFRYWFVYGGLQKNSAGWDKDANLIDGRIQMRPINLRGTALAVLVFFGGGGGWAMLIALESGAGLNTKDWVMYLGCLAFTVAGLYMLWLSSMRIEFDEASIHRTLFLTQPFSANFSEIDSVTSRAQNFRSGVVLKFSDGRRLVVSARMTGYIALLGVLPKRDEALLKFLREHRNNNQRGH